MARENAELLRSFLMHCERDKRLDIQQFFGKWFREGQEPHFVVFKKNYRATNIQFAELRALIREALARAARAPGDSQSIQILTTDGFNEGVLALVDTFDDQFDDQSFHRYDTFIELYAPLLYRTVVIEPYYGSCAVYVPPGVTINWLEICAASGYIHACGPLLMLRRVDRTTVKDLARAIERHTAPRKTSSDRNATGGGILPFRVYCHEHFGAPRRSAGAERDGVEELRIHLDKYYMGPKPLAEAVKMVCEQHKKTIAPVSGSSEGQPDSLDRRRSLWLLVDNAIDDRQSQRADDAFYVCYEQRFSNKNPFQILDENKPAWVAQTTLPHSLAAAMINISRPTWPTADRTMVALCDPFVGTGTTWLEGLKEPRILASGSDESPIVRLLVHDNVRVFAMSAGELGALIERLSLEAGRGKGKGARRRLPRSIAEFLDDHRSSDDRTTLDVLAEVLPHLELHERIHYYVALRVRRHSSEIFRSANRPQDAFCNELNQMLGELRDLAALRALEASPQNGSVSVVQGEYSSGSTMTHEYLAPFATTEHVGTSIKPERVEGLQRNTYDVIVADPPYGFNTDEDPAKLARVYRDAIVTMVAALKPYGQLVLCLPERSRTGRPLPYFTTKDIVIRQVVAAAEDQGRRVVDDSFVPSRMLALFRQPFFWESPRALRRSILHFQFTEHGTPRGES